jgi:hypothetical protein
VRGRTRGWVVGYDAPMRLEALMFITLAPFIGGCGGCCHAPNETFVVRAALSEDALAELLQGGDMSREDLDCEKLCELVYERDRGWRMDTAGVCWHEIARPEQVPADGIVARVRCRGEGVEYYCKGRRPLGHVECVEAPGGDELGTYLARCAHLEAASVVAFTELAAQLAALGAPAGLVARCRTAATEEARHAAVLGGLADARGATVARPQQRPCEASLAAIARHNAVEGCVHEAWAAVGATWQAVHARDPELRAAFATIAVEEAGHAQLAWDLHTWLIGQLGGEERKAVLTAQRAAIAELPGLAAAELGPPELGMPGSAVLAAMATRFAAGLRAAA